jgi:hypothetical protein
MNETAARGQALEVYRQFNQRLGRQGLTPCEDGDFTRAHRGVRGDRLWVFEPTVTGWRRDPQLAAAYPTYVVHDDGDVQRVPSGTGQTGL